MGKGKRKRKIEERKGKCQEDTRGGSHYSEEAVYLIVGNRKWRNWSSKNVECKKYPSENERNVLLPERSHGIFALLWITGVYTIPVGDHTCKIPTDDHSSYLFIPYISSTSICRCWSSVGILQVWSPTGMVYTPVIQSRAKMPWHGKGILKSGWLIH